MTMAPPSSSPGQTGNDSSTAAKRFKPNYLDTITVLVGNEETEQQPFIVHKDFICNKSAFFTAACASVWNEGKEGIVRLPEMDPAVFKIYVHWIYTNHIDLSISEPTPFANCTHEDHASQVEECVNLGKTWAILETYMTADVLLDIALKNETINQLLRMLGSNTARFSPPLLNAIWGKVSKESGLRRCIIDFYATRVSAKRFEKLGEGLAILDKEVIYDFFIRTLEVRTLSNPDTRPNLARRCVYHEHGEGEDKCGSG